MEITKKDIEHIASLSMLNLSEDEISGYAKDMQEILSFVDTINELDTDNTEESAFALDSYNVLRKDEVKESLDRELLMQNAPSSNGVQYQIPPIIEWFVWKLASYGVSTDVCGARRITYDCAPRILASL